MPILKVEKMGNGEGLHVSWPEAHPKSNDIERWVKYLSPGYVEYLLQFGCDPHCSSCRDIQCPNRAMGDDACPAFKFGERW